MTATTTTTEGAAQDARVRALAHELRIAVRILNREVSDLVLADNGPAPAWTDFDRVYLNRSQLPQDVRTPRDIAVFVGAALHELGHTIFSPRPGAPLYERLASAQTLAPSGLMGTLNLVEDQRQERAIIGRFSPTRGYLSALVVDLILSGNAADTSWPLVCGRTWLPKAARAASRASWVEAFGEQSAREVARLVGAFQRLTDVGDADHLAAAQHVIDLHALLADSAMPTDGCGSGVDSNRKGENVPTPDEGPETADDADEDLSGDDDADGDGNGAPTADEDADDEGADDGDTNGAGSGEGDDEGDADDDATGNAADADDVDGDADEGKTSNGDDADDEDGEGSESDAPSTGSGEGSPDDDTTPTTTGNAPTADDVAKALDDAVSDVLSDDDVAQELSEYADAVDRASGGADLPERVADNGYRSDVDERIAVVAERLADVLGDLRADADSSWLRGTDRGRINVPRLYDPTGGLDPSRLFDQFTPDTLDATSVEAVVIVDVSGSMYGSEAALSDAVHAIHVAADRAEVALTVLGFGAYTHTIIDRSERPSGVVNIQCREDYTKPLESLRAAYDVLRASEAAHKVALIMSDGDWQRSERDDSEAIIGAMRADGMQTLSAFYQTGYVGGHDETMLRDLYAHGAETFAVMNDLGTLVDMFGDVVQRLMAEGAMR